MQVNEAMTSDVKVANPSQTICDAARLMAQIDVGVLPVGENDRLVGMITDRDIAIRAVGAGKGPQTTDPGDHEQGGDVLLRGRRPRRRRGEHGGHKGAPVAGARS
jgi:CBS domain-containing protein